MVQIVCLQEKWHKKKLKLRETFGSIDGYFTLDFFSFKDCFGFQFGSAFPDLFSLSLIHILRGNITNRFMVPDGIVAGYKAVNFFR